MFFWVLYKNARTRINMSNFSSYSPLKRGMGGSHLNARETEGYSFCTPLSGGFFLIFFLFQNGGSDNSGAIFREVTRMRTMLLSERERDRDFVMRIEQLCEKMRVCML